MTVPSIVSGFAAVETRQLLASCTGIVSRNTSGVRVARCPVTTVVGKKGVRITGGSWAARFYLSHLRSQFFHCRRKQINHFD